MNNTSYHALSSNYSKSKSTSIVNNGISTRFSYVLANKYVI